MRLSFFIVKLDFFQWFYQVLVDRINGGICLWIEGSRRVLLCLAAYVSENTVGGRIGRITGGFSWNIDYKDFLQLKSMPRLNMLKLKWGRRRYDDIVEIQNLNHLQKLLPHIKILGCTEFDIWSQILENSYNEIQPKLMFKQKQPWKPLWFHLEVV